LICSCAIISQDRNRQHQHYLIYSQIGGLFSPIQRLSFLGPQRPKPPNMIVIPFSRPSSAT
jgi:hypothetical protein